MKPLFSGKKANSGVNLLIGIVMFNIIMYVFIYYANADAISGSLGSGTSIANSINATTNSDLSDSDALHWYSGFNVSMAFSMPVWVTVFYVTFQAFLLSLAVYSLIRGLG